MQLRIVFIYIFLFCVAGAAHAQTFGVRAGLNQSTLLGPTIDEETYGFSTGFHFGISYAYNFSDIVSLRGEIAYIQNGYEYNYNGDGFFIIRTAENTVYEKGTVELNLENSLGYISLPIVVNAKLNRKWQVNGGVYFNYLVSPVGQGQLRFVSAENPEDIVFRQRQDYQYYSDEAREGRNDLLGPIGVIVDGEVVNISRYAGAYYQHGEKSGNLINSVDVGLTAGIDYFINKGFYIGLSVDYGLPDITNNDMDFERNALNEDNTFRFSDDSDTHLGLKASIGFRF